MPRLTRLQEPDESQTCDTYREGLGLISQGSKATKHDRSGDKKART